MPGAGQFIGVKKYFQSIIGKDDDGQNLLSSKFTRTAFHHPTLPKVLISYKGDETLSSKLPHGNSTSVESKKIPFVPTMPSLLRDIEEKKGDYPANVYRKINATVNRNIKEQAAQAPRNLKQVQNTMHNLTQKLRLSRDSLYNLHVRAFDGTFIKEILTFPDLVVIGWNDGIAGAFLSLLGTSQSVGLFYDTTFRLGDYYVSIFSFVDVEFTNKPTIPLLFMIHERKTFETHDLFWRKVKNKLPGLSKAKNVYIVSDEESAIVEAMRQNLPTTDIYRCWNHVMQNAKFNLKKFGITSKSEISVYLDDIRELLAQTDHKKYTDLLLKRIASWNQVFLN